MTIVFLPLSFFTSYYGMNLEGISDTAKDENWFWQTFGPISFLLIFATAIFAYRKDLTEQLNLVLIAGLSRAGKASGRLLRWTKAPLRSLRRQKEESGDMDMDMMEKMD